MARSSRSESTATIEMPVDEQPPRAAIDAAPATTAPQSAQDALASMQAAAATPAKALARAMPTLGKTATPAGHRTGSPTLPTVALRGQKIQLLMGQMLARSVANQTATAAVLPWHFNADTWNEIVGMQTAVAQRLQQQHNDWVRGLTEIMQGYSQLRLANTLSKFAEQEYNLGAQIGALMNDQLTDFVELMENVQVDYGYWIAQKRAAALGE